MGSGGRKQLHGHGEAGRIPVNDIVCEELGDGNQGEGSDRGRSGRGTDNLQERMKQRRGIEGTNVFATLEVTP